MLSLTALYPLPSLNQKYCGCDGRISLDRIVSSIVRIFPSDGLAGCLSSMPGTWAKEITAMYVAVTVAMNLFIF